MASASDIVVSEAETPNVIKFGYINFKVDAASKSISANCKKCKAPIKEKLGTTSAFVRHLSISTHEHLRHEYDLWKEDNVKTGGIGTNSSQRLISSFSSLQSFYQPSHHRQRELTDALISNLIIKGNMPLSLVEQSWFRQFMKVVDAKYKTPSRYKVTRTLSQQFHTKRALLRSKLIEAQYVTLTLDMWSDRRMRSYMGITVHFVSNDMKLRSFLLDFAHFSERHSGDKLADHCTKVIEDFDLRCKVVFLITDNAANMVSAFRNISGMLGTIDPETVEQEDNDKDNDADEYGAGYGLQSDSYAKDDGATAELEAEEDMDETADSFAVMTECTPGKTDQVLEYIGGIAQKRIPCCIHTLQLVIIDGLRAAKFMGTVQSKASRLSTVLHTSGPFQQKYFAVFKTTVPRANSTRWNSMFLQLAAIDKLDPTQLQKILTETKNDVCILTKREWEILKEVIDVLEPAYNATLIMEEETSLISLVAPTVLALHSKWLNMSGHVKFADTLVAALLSSLENRFIGLFINVSILPSQKTTKGDIIDPSTLNFGDPAYLVAAAIDPEFKLEWLGENKDELKIAITALVVREAKRLLQVQGIVRAAVTSAHFSSTATLSSEDRSASAASTSHSEAQPQLHDPHHPLHLLRKTAGSGRSPTVPAKKLKLFDFMSKHIKPSATQHTPEQPDVSRDFQRFLDCSAIGLQIFDDPLFASSLRPLAVQLFSAPCSSAASERVFSQSGLIMKPTRSRLSPNSAVCCNS